MDIKNCKVGNWVKCIESKHADVLQKDKIYLIERIEGNFIYFGPTPDGWFASRFSSASYEEAQEQNGLKVGDRVRIIRKAESYEAGWNCGWTGGMNRFIGQIGEVVSISDNAGVKVRTEISSYYYPFFVLEKVEEDNMKLVKYYCKNKVEAAALIAAAKEAGYGVIGSYNDKYSIFSRLETKQFSFAELNSNVDMVSSWIKISLEEMLGFIAQPRKELPKPIMVGDYKTEWLIENNKITKIKVGCQTVNMSTIEEILNAVETYNKD